MAHILLLETADPSPLESYLREMNHSVTRFYRPKNKEDEEDREESARKKDEQQRIECGAFPDLIIRDEDFGTDFEGEFTSIPHILIVEEFDPVRLQSRLSFSRNGFLLRPLSRDSVLSVVGNALGMGSISLATVLNSLNMPFYVLDARTYRVVLSNRAARELYRTAEGTCYELSHHRSEPCAGEHHVCPLEKVIKTKQPYSTEHTHFTPEGEKRFVEVRGYPIFDRDHEVSHMIEYSLDISDKKREVLEIRKLSTAIDQSDNIILITDCDGRVEFANRAFEMHQDVSRQELLGKMVRDLNDGSDKAQFYAILGEAIEQQQPVMREFSYAKSDYSSSWERVSVSPIRGDDSEIIHYIAVADDITLQVHRKRELERAKEEAERASVMKSQFLANISHEIRTPLNIILGFTDILADDEVDEKKRTQMTNIRHAGNQLLSLIDDVLDFSKIEASKLTLEESPFSLRGTLDRIEERFRDAAEKKGISFHVRHETTYPRTVRGDEDRVLQILSNLLSNAVKFTSEGDIELKCRYRDDELVVRITDTGIGIEEHRREDVFSPFEQIDGSTSRKYGGTGLGLAITRSIVEQMGGRIELESSLGNGTSFTVTIPLPPPGDGQNDESEIESEDEGDGEEMPASGEGKRESDTEDTKTGEKRVLIAEDNGINQRLMRIMLEKMGYSCAVAADGVETLEKLGEEHYDVLLLDMHMPVKDGMEVVEELRQDDRLRDIYVIALTASAMKGDEENFIAAGCDDYLPKPVNKNDLEGKLRNVSSADL